MIIKSISLENIRSYKKETFEFENGINFLSGDIGSGKSTILLAIEFALFGFKKGDLEGFTLLRKGEKEANITLCLKNDSDVIEIFRKIKKGKSNEVISQENGYIKINENIVDLAPTELNAHVFEILNFPKEFLTKDKNLIYRFTIYTAQEQLKEIIFAESEKRLEVIRKIFAIDKYKLLKDGISIYSNKIREDKKVFAAKIEPLEKIISELDILEKEIIILNSELKSLNDIEIPIIEKIKKFDLDLQKIEELLEKLGNNILQRERRKSQIEQIIKNQNNLEIEKKDKIKILEELKKINYIELKDKNNKLILIENEKLSEIELKKKNLLEKLEKLEKLEIEKNRLQKIITEIELKNRLAQTHKSNLNTLKIDTEISLLAVLIEELRNQILNLEKLFENDKKDKEDLLKLKIELKNIDEKTSELEKSVHSVDKLENCPTCLQEVSKDHKNNLHEKIKEEILTYTKKKSLIEENINILNRTILDNEKALETLAKDKEKLIISLEKLNNLNINKKKDDEIKIVIENLNKEIIQLEQDNPKEKINQIIEYINSNNMTRKEFESLTKDEILFKGNISNLNQDILKITIKENEIKVIEEDILKIEKKKAIESVEIEKKIENDEKLELYKSNEDKLKQKKANLIESLNELKKEEKKSNIEIASKKAIIDTKKMLLEEKSFKIKELEILQKKYISLIDNENFLLNKAVNITNIIEKAIFTKYYAQFCENFEKLFKELIEDNNIEVRLDADFSPVIEQNGYDLDIKNLSGGEKSSIAIAYRLALKQIIETNISRQKLSLLILDEPTDGFSKEQVDRLGNILKEINLEQIILVSHDEKIESICDRVFHIEKTNHISELK